jgi:cysteinyl-tRNA synthetase
MTWYSCGPTVYDFAHAGHARTYILTDMIRRIKEYSSGAPIHFVMNITDIDDKIIASGADAKQYERLFWEDMDALHVMRPTKIYRVTEVISDINPFIERILENGYAYIVNGSVYVLEGGRLRSEFDEHWTYEDDGCRIHGCDICL